MKTLKTPSFPQKTMVVALGLFAFSAILALAQPNIWTKSTTGAWQEPFWSLGVTPSSTHAVLFTNDNSKTLWITGDTARQAPNSLTVNALVVSAPANTLNTLRLEAPGLPLRIADTLLLGENSFLQFADAAIEVGDTTSGNLLLGGFVDHQNASDLRAHAIQIGHGAAGQYDLRGGTLSAGTLDVGGTGFDGYFNQHGGVSAINLVVLHPQGHLNLNDGRLDSTSFVIGEGDTQFRATGAEPVFTQASGTIRLEEQLIVGQGNRGSGVYTLAGGLLNSALLRLGANRNAAGTFEQSGGTNQTGRLIISEEADDPMTLPDIYARSGYFMTGGALRTTNTVVGSGREGIFRQNGGEHSVDGVLQITGDSVRSSYSLLDGVVSARRTTVAKATFAQSGGINRISDLLAIGLPNAGDAQNALQPSASTYELTGGDLFIHDLWLGGEFIHTAGGFHCSGSITMAGGRFTSTGATGSLGALALAAPSRIVFGTAASVHQWAPSADEIWNADAKLQVHNWAGSLNGEGLHQLRFGTDRSGLTRGQLTQIVFVNPAGLPAGNYPARILETGEVVPEPAPLLAIRATAHAVFVDWAGAWALQGATNLHGPYEDIPDATQPYTRNVSQGSKAFFRLRNLDVATK